MHLRNEEILMSEQELIERLSIGDKQAFTTLYKQYWSQVYHFSRLYLQSVDEAEEVVQEVFVKLWENRMTLRNEGKLSAYLFIITRNLIFNQFRRSFNEEEYQRTLMTAYEQSYNMEQEFVAADLKNYIQQIVAELPPRQQEVFRMSREQHLPYKEIAKQLGISEKTVERHINEALKFLKRNLALYILFLA